VILSPQTESNSNPGGVKHDSDPLADSLGGKVLGELGSDGTAATVSARHFAPDDPKLVGFVVRSGNASRLLGLVDVGALLAEVEVRVTATGHSLQPQKSSVLMLATQSTLVAGEDGLDVEAAWRLDGARLLGRGLFHGGIDFGNFRHVLYFTESFFSC